MEEQIKRAVRNLNISYIFFWVLPAFLLGAGEFELLPVGSLADNAQAVYYFETLGILLTALCIPLSLKLFSLVLKKKIDQMTITLALKCYEHCPSRHIGSRYRYQSFMLLSDA